jgi:amino acid adenylation domain-containing protein
METIDCTIASDWITEQHSVALRSGDSTLTYEQLDRQAGKLAGHLSHLGIAHGHAVAICMERSFDWIVAALAIMRVGAAYIPLDANWPDAHLRYVLENSGASALVARAATLNRIAAGLPGPALPGIDPRRDSKLIAAARRFEPIPIDPESLAYIFYTSGPTGVPKGVEITHANLSHLISFHNQAFAVSRFDRASHLAGLGSDAAGWELWPYLAAGATICLADDSVRCSPELVRQWMVYEGITIGFVPAVYAAQMMAMKWPRATELRLLLTRGDAFNAAPSPGLPFEVVNSYGPSECTVISTSCILKPGPIANPSVGRAIAGAGIYLLDDCLSQVPDGQVAEIFIGGAGVGRGYRNLPDLTQRSFMPDPFSELPGARMFRTGDLGVRLPNGDIALRGRADSQPNVRGRRVEFDPFAPTPQPHQYASPAFAHAAIEVQTPRHQYQPQHQPAPVLVPHFVASALPANSAPSPIRLRPAAQPAPTLALSDLRAIVRDIAQWKARSLDVFHTRGRLRLARRRCQPIRPAARMGS